jgi:hypothetical protein
MRKIGKIHEPDYPLNRNIKECASGIHFVKNRSDAEKYFL